MKQLILFIITTTLLNSQTSNVKIGMTYDEVQAVLGRPTSINRGFTELYDFTDFYSMDTKGQLIYVRWEYANKAKTEIKNIYKYQTEYDESLSSKSYDSAQVANYQSKYDSSTSEWDKKFYLEKLIQRKEYLKTSMEQYSKHDSLKRYSSLKKTPENYKKYVIKYVWCVLFDASSGRVTNQGYYPISVVEK
ncbi:MAG: hypothetical protein KJ963_03085 [Bacteroidetes bacterium]|nr:hypothetical protein [Bacteroidota bacterium]